MDGTTLFALIVGGVALLAITLYFRVWLVSIVGVVWWLYLAIANGSEPMLAVAFVCMALINAFITVVLIRGRS